MTEQASLGDSFNAKVMTFDQVAKSFVVSEKFRQLSGQYNSLLLGPRGTGKTTLLKMLSVEGLRAWRPLDDSKLKQSVRFSGIYVPADIAWGEQVKGLVHRIEDPDDARLVENAAFTTNVLQAVTAAMSAMLEPPRDREDETPFLHRQVQPKKLEEVVDYIAELWKLQIKSLSVRALSRALGLRLVDIYSQVDLIGARKGGKARPVAEAMPYLGVSFLHAVAQAVSTFNEASDAKGSRWGLLLDELEIAPEQLQRNAITALRGGVEPLLVKAALVPCGRHAEVSASDAMVTPATNNDMVRIELWYADKDAAANFSRDVFRSFAGRFGGRSPEEVFGDSPFDVVDASEGAEEPTANEVGAWLTEKRSTTSRWQKHFRSLAAKDVSFRHFLDRHEIEIDRMDMRPSTRKGNLLRKIAPVVAFRDAYLSGSGSGPRGVKPFNSAYCGWEAIAAICEGNPRWLKSLLTSLEATTKTPDAAVISHTAQQRLIMGLATSYEHMLKAGASSTASGIKSNYAVFEILRLIGSYFHKRIVMESFSEEVPASFIIDDEVDDGIEKCLRIALNLGAIVVFDPPNSASGYKSLRGLTCRLSYMLAPTFKLPLRKAKPIQLTSIIKGWGGETRHQLRLL